MVRNWLINHDGVPITKFDIPAALSSFIYQENYCRNIKSGFKCCELCPFEPNNIDYSKIIKLKRIRDEI